MNERIKTEGLSVGYDGKALIENINISVGCGEILTLIGPNGSGKSTILKTIIKQLSAVKGTVFLDGKDMAGIPGKDIASKLSVLMTERIKPELMSCRDIVATGRYPYTGRLGFLSQNDKRIVEESIELVNAGDFAESDFNEISDGQKQRVLLARAVCQEPEVIVLDEPTSFLDIRYKLELLNILKMLANERHVSVIMSLHELDLAQKISDRIVCVKGREIERVGTPDEIFSGDYISKLYELESESYNSSFGSIELKKTGGVPEVFVIGGGGSGINTYRLLQRNGVSFAAGVLSENDIDYPVAKALASTVFSERPYVPISKETSREAEKIMDSCKKVICCLDIFTDFNLENKRLREKAKRDGKLSFPETEADNVS